MSNIGPGQAAGTGAAETPRQLAGAALPESMSYGPADKDGTSAPKALEISFWKDAFCRVRIFFTDLQGRCAAGTPRLPACRLSGIAMMDQADYPPADSKGAVALAPVAH